MKLQPLLLKVFSETHYKHKHSGLKVQKYFIYLFSVLHIILLNNIEIVHEFLFELDMHFKE